MTTRVSLVGLHACSVSCKNHFYLRDSISLDAPVVDGIRFPDLREAKLSWNASSQHLLLVFVPFELAAIFLSDSVAPLTTQKES